MSRNEFDKKEVVEGPLTWVFSKEYDESPDLSWLGEYEAKQPDCPFYDRANHTLVVKIDTVYDEKTEEEKTVYEAYRMTGRGDEKRAVEVEYDPEDGHVDRNEYRYIAHFQSPPDENEKAYASSTPEELAEVIKKYGSVKAAAVYPCLWDAERLDDCGKGWSSIGLVLKLKIDGEEVDEESLWGIESDLDDAYEKEVYGDLRSQIEDRFEKTAETLDAEVKRALKRAAVLRDKLKDKKTDEKPT